MNSEPTTRSTRVANLLTNGYLVVVHEGVAHRVDGDCWPDDPNIKLIPFATVHEAVAHGNQACGDCKFGGVATAHDVESDD